MLAESLGFIGEVEWDVAQNLEQMHEAHVAGPFRAVRAFLPLLRESKGRIITIGGFAGTKRKTRASIVFCSALR